MKLLIIEDDEHLGRAYRSIFRRHEVALCTTGEEAIALLSSESFDFILSDFNLATKLTGGDVLDWIEVNKPELVEKFVFCSASHEAKRRHHRVFEKPFDIHQLVKTIEEAA